MYAIRSYYGFEPIPTFIMTPIELAWVTFRSGKGYPEEFYLWQEQQLADQGAAVPYVGIGYSVWGIILNIEEIKSQWIEIDPWIDVITSYSIHYTKLYDQ